MRPRLPGVRTNRTSFHNSFNRTYGSVRPNSASSQNLMTNTLGIKRLSSERSANAAFHRSDTDWAFEHDF